MATELAPFLKPLYDEIVNDPEGHGYAAMTAAELKAYLEAPRYMTLMEHAASRFTDRTLADMWGPDRVSTLLDILDQQAAAGDKKVALFLKLLRDGAAGGVSAGSDKTRIEIDNFVTSGLITAAEGAELKALGERWTSILDRIGFRYKTVSEAWINLIRTVASGG